MISDLFPALASHVWTSTVFLLAVLIVLFALRRRLTAGARSSLALVGLAKFALPDALAGAGLELLTGDAFRLVSRGSFEGSLRTVAGALRVDSVPDTAQLWPAAVLGLWGTVALALILRLAWAHRRLVRLAKQSVFPALPREAEALERARRLVGLRHPVDLVRSTLPEAPAALGVARPLIILPAAGCGDLSDDELESLLCHECAHVVRRDNLVAGFVAVLCALFWFHPLVWIARRILSIERERACDEIAVSAAGRGDIYLAALAKFCHAAIGPELPGVSRMATAQLKERMDHIMHHAALEAQSPSPWRVTLLAVSALVLFTLASGAVGSGGLFTETEAKLPYAVRVTATRSGEGISIAGSVRENATQKVIAAPSLMLRPGGQGGVRTSASEGLQVSFDVRPGTGDQFLVDVKIEKSGTEIQKSTLRITPSSRQEEAPSGPPQKFSGEPINLSVTNADLRQTLDAFGKVAGLKMQIEDGVQGKVSMSWDNVPWDEALDSIIRENGLTYRIEGSTLHISRR